MKKLFKGAIFIALVAIVITGCDKENITPNNNNLDNIQKLDNYFSLDVFNERGTLYSILDKIDLSPVYINNVETIDYNPLTSALDSINDSLGTNMTITNFDTYQVENQDKGLADYLNEGFITQQEYDILEIFLNDIESYSFEQSIENLEVYINSLNLSTEEFAKYDDLVNILLIIDDYYVEQGVNIFSSIDRPELSPGCAVSIASNAVSTLSLSSCFVPGPWCAVAVAGKALSLAGMYFSC